MKGKWKSGRGIGFVTCVRDRMIMVLSACVWLDCYKWVIRPSECTGAELGKSRKSWESAQVSLRPLSAQLPPISSILHPAWLFSLPLFPAPLFSSLSHPCYNYILLSSALYTQIPPISAVSCDQGSETAVLSRSRCSITRSEKLPLKQPRLKLGKVQKRGAQTVASVVETLDKATTAPISSGNQKQMQIVAMPTWLTPWPSLLPSSLPPLSFQHLPIPRKTAEKGVRGKRESRFTLNLAEPIQKTPHRFTNTRTHTHTHTHTPVLHVAGTGSLWNTLDLH